MERYEIKNNLSIYYKDLKNAVNTKDINTIINNLNVVKGNIIKDKKLVTNALYLLIQNNNLEEAAKLINEFDFDKGCKEQIKILKIAINEMNHLTNLDENQIQVYNNAILQGSYYYHNFELENAYDYYTWGLYVTNAPIFYYYIGKIFYKSNNYKEASFYFNQYIKLGATKLDKAFLYLTKISEKYKNVKKSKNYSNYVLISGEILGHEYDFYSIYEEEHDPYKIQMQNILDLSEEFFKRK